MEVYSLATLSFLVLTLIWAGAIIILWATRPIAHPLLFIQALAAVGVVIICALAGMSTFNQASDNTWLWRAVFAACGIVAAIIAARQTYRLMHERHFDLRGPANQGRRRRKR